MTTFLQHLAWQLGITDDPWARATWRRLDAIDAAERDASAHKPEPVFYKRNRSNWCETCGCRTTAGKITATGIRYFCRKHL